MAKIRYPYCGAQSDPVQSIFCPVCQTEHLLRQWESWVEGATVCHQCDPERPTHALVTSVPRSFAGRDLLCEFTLANGRICYTEHSTHRYAMRSIELPDWSDRDARAWLESQGMLAAIDAHPGRSSAPPGDLPVAIQPRPLTFAEYCGDLRPTPKSG